MDSVEKLYNTISNQYNVGSLDEFRKKMQSEESRKKLYDVVSEKYNLGDYDTYNQKVALASGLNENATATANGQYSDEQIAQFKSSPFIHDHNTAAPIIPNQQTIGNYTPEVLQQFEQENPQFKGANQNDPEYQQQVKAWDERQKEAKGVEFAKSIGHEETVMSNYDLDTELEQLRKIVADNKAENEAIRQRNDSKRANQGKGGYAGVGAAMARSMSNEKPLEFEKEKELDPEIAKRLNKLELEAVRREKMPLYNEVAASENELTQLEQNGVDNYDISVARDLNEKTKKLLHAGSKYDDSSVWSNWVQGMKDTFTDEDTYTSGITEIVRAGHLTKIVNKMNEGKQLTREEQLALQSYLNYAEAQDIRSSDLALSYQMGQGTAQSVPFMAEMFLACGAGTIAKKTIVKTLLNQGKKELAEKVAKSLGGVVLKNGAEEVVIGETKGIGKKLIKEAVEDAAIAGISPTTGATIERNRLNATLAGEEYNWLDVARDFTSATQEVFTERMGGKFVEGVVNKAIPVNKIWGNVGKKLGVSEFVQSPIAETGEEYLGALLNYARSVNPAYNNRSTKDHQYNDHSNEDLRNESNEMFTKEGLLRTAGTVAPLSIVGGGMNMAILGLDSHVIGRYDASRQKLKDLMQQYDKSGDSESIEQVVSSIEASQTSEEFIKRVAQLRNVLRTEALNNGATPEEIEQQQKSIDNIINGYANSAKAFNIMIGNVNDRFEDLSAEEQQRIRDDFDAQMARYKEAETNKTAAQTEIDNANADIDAQTNVTTGHVTNVRLGNEESPYTVKSGKIEVITDDEGKPIIDKSKSDKLVVVEGADGKAHQISIDEISEVVGDASADELKQTSATTITNRINNETNFPVGSLVFDEQTGAFQPVVASDENGVTMVAQQDGNIVEVQATNEDMQGKKAVPLQVGSTFNTDKGVVKVTAQNGDRYQISVGNQVIEDEYTAVDLANLLQQLQYNPIQAEQQAQQAQQPTAENTQPTNVEPQQSVDTRTPERKAYDEFTQKHGANTQKKLYNTLQDINTRREKVAKELAELDSQIENMPDAWDAESEKKATALQAKRDAKAQELATIDQAKTKYESLQQQDNEVHRAEYEAKAQAEAEAKARSEEQARINAEKAEAERKALLAEQEKNGHVPDMANDKASDARERGFRMVNGQRVDFQSISKNNDGQLVDNKTGNVIGFAGKPTKIRFTNNDVVDGYYAIVDSEYVQPSHINGVRNPKFTIPEAQPKERTDKATDVATTNAAKNPNYNELTSGETAYTNATVVQQSSLSSIQGTGRRLIIDKMQKLFPENARAYEQHLADNAENWGATREQVESLQAQGKHPMLVRIVDVDANEAIRLGQKKASDTESGGIERIRAVETANSLGDNISNYAEMLLNTTDEEATLNDAIVENGRKVINYLRTKNIITDTQYQSAFDSKGNITPEAKEDLLNVLKQVLFKDAEDNLPTKFATLPAAAQKAILQTIHRDLQSEKDASVLADIQEAIAAYYDMQQESDFNQARTEQDVKNAVYLWSHNFVINFNDETYVPIEKFSNFAIELATIFKTKSLKTQRELFNQLYNYLQGKADAQLDLFGDNEAVKLDKKEAIKRTYNVEHNKLQDNGETNNERRSTLGVDNTNGERGESGSTERTDGREPSASGTRIADDRASNKVERTVEQISKEYEQATDNAKKAELLEEYSELKGYENTAVCTTSNAVEVARAKGVKESWCNALEKSIRRKRKFDGCYLPTKDGEGIVLFNVDYITKPSEAPYSHENIHRANDKYYTKELAQFAENYSEEELLEQLDQVSNGLASEYEWYNKEALADEIVAYSLENTDNLTSEEISDYIDKLNVADNTKQLLNYIAQNGRTQNLFERRRNAYVGNRNGSRTGRVQTTDGGRPQEMGEQNAVVHEPSNRQSDSSRENVSNNETNRENKSVQDGQGLGIVQRLTEVSRAVEEKKELGIYELGDDAEVTDSPNDVAFSIKSATTESIESLIRRTGRRYANVSNGDIKNILDTYKDVVTEVSEIAKDFRLFDNWQNQDVVLSKDGRLVYNIVQSNGDTDAPTIEFSLTCVKKEAMNAVVDLLIETNKIDKLTTNTQLQQLIDALEQRGYSVPCKACYIEGKRQNLETYRNLCAKWERVAKKAGIDTTKNIADDITAELDEKQINVLKNIASKESVNKTGKKVKGDNDYDGTEIAIAKMFLSEPRLRGGLNYTDIITPSRLDKVLTTLEGTEFDSFYSRFNAASTPKENKGVAPFSTRMIEERLAVKKGGIGKAPMASYLGREGIMYGGFRQNSFSDADPLLFLDYYQFMTFLKSTGSGMFAYTKVPFYTDLFGESGVMINQSIMLDIFAGSEEHRNSLGLNKKEYKQWLKENSGYVPVGTEEHKKMLDIESDEEYNKWKAENNKQDGDLEIYLSHDSFPLEQAFEMRTRPQYEGRVGITAVATSDKMMSDMLSDDRFDVVIGLHRSGATKEQAKRTNYDIAKDYTGTNETRIADMGKQSGYRNLSASDVTNDNLPSYPDLMVDRRMSGDFEINSAIQQLGDAREAANAYLEWCKINNLKPKYEQFANHPNYYKLLVDFRAYDNEGEPVLQDAVTAQLPKDWAQKLRTYLSERSENKVLVSSIKNDKGLVQDIDDILNLRFHTKKTKVDDSQLSLFDFDEVTKEATNEVKEDENPLSETNVAKFKEYTTRFAHLNEEERAFAQRYIDARSNQIDDELKQISERRKHIELFGTESMALNSQWTTLYVEQKKLVDLKNYFNGVYIHRYPTHEENEAKAEKTYDRYISLEHGNYATDIAGYEEDIKKLEKQRTKYAKEKETAERACNIGDFVYADYVVDYDDQMISAVKRIIEYAKQHLTGNEEIGRDLGIKSGRVSHETVVELFNRLNKDQYNKELFDRVEKVCKELGVVYRFGKLKGAFGEHVTGGFITYNTEEFNSGAYTDQKKANTILHEMIHGVTSTLVVAYNNPGTIYYRMLTSEQKSAIQNLKDIYRAIETDANFTGEYGLTDVHEMIAEMSNPVFREKLEKKNLWVKLLDAIRNLIAKIFFTNEVGGTKQTNALKEIELAVDYLLENNNLEVENALREYEKRKYAKYRNFYKVENEMQEEPNVRFRAKKTNVNDGQLSLFDYDDVTKDDNSKVWNVSKKLASEMQDIKERAEKDGTFMKAPNGKQSNLNERNWLLTRTQAFKEWFGDSKIVDENGEPLVVYHRTNNDFTTFDKSKLYSSSTWATALFGFYFNNKIEEGRYGDKSMPCFLNIQNPIVIDVDHFADFDYDYKRTDPEELWSKGDGIQVNIKRESKKIDGKYVLVPVEQTDHSSKAFVAFEPNQIKSATENQDITNDSDIRFHTQLPAPKTTAEYFQFIEKATPKNADLNEVLDAELRFHMVNHNSPYLLKRADGAFVDPETGEHLGFDHRFMGKGEGAQAHGWGSYFSVQDIRSYAETGTSDYEFRGKSANEQNVPVNLVNLFTVLNDYDKVKNRLEEWIEENKQRGDRNDILSQQLKALEFLNSTKKEEWKPSRHHYDVEIPNNNGENYIEEYQPATEKQKYTLAWEISQDEQKRADFVDRIRNTILDEWVSDYIEYQAPRDFAEAIKDESIDSRDFVQYWSDIREMLIDYMDNDEYNGSDLYSLAKEFAFDYPQDREISLYLNKIGYTGIHYVGGRDGECYVLFNDKDAVIKDHVRFHFIGEQGAKSIDQAQEATTRMDNLEIARAMEKAGKSEEVIKPATGWERGADGKWRYEIDPLQIKEGFEWKDKNEIKKLGDIIEDKELFEAYPFMRNMNVEIVGTDRFDGAYVPEDKIILLNKSLFENRILLEDVKEVKEITDSPRYKEYVEKRTNLIQNAPDLFTESSKSKDYWEKMSALKDEYKDVIEKRETAVEKAQREKSYIIETHTLNQAAKQTITHELQHAIQYVEGFAKGGNTKTKDPNKEETHYSKLAKLRMNESELSTKLYHMNSDYNKIQDKFIDLRKEFDSKYGEDWELESIDKEDRSKWEQVDTELADNDKKRYAIIDKIQSIKNEIEEVGNEDLTVGVEGYKKLAGEVEARNAAFRMDFTPNMRRGMVASFTEDVSRKDQIFLRNAWGAYSMSANESETDKKYADAYKNGDEKAARELLVEAYKAKYPDTKVVDENGNPLVMHHVTDEEFTTFDPTMSNYNGAMFFKSTEGDGGMGSRIMNVFLNITKPIELNTEYYVGSADMSEHTSESDGVINRYAKDLNGNDVNGVVATVFDANQIKSADTFTFDDNGELIPLSKRFDNSEDDIRFHTISQEEYDKAIAKQTPKNTTLDEALELEMRFHMVNHNSPYLLKRADGSFVDPETGERLGFDHRFMGSGEGAQVHGWGSYFSVNDLRNYASVHSSPSYREYFDIDINNYSREDAMMIKDISVNIYSTLADGLSPKDALDRFIYNNKKALKEKQDELEAQLKEIAENTDENGIYHREGQDYTKSDIDKLVEDWHKRNTEFHEHRIKFAEELEKIVKKPERHHYSVEIPDNNGSNYIEENGWNTYKIIKKIQDQAKKEGHDWLYERTSSMAELAKSTKDKQIYINGDRLYDIAKQTFKYDKKEASEFLNRAGIVGVHYTGKRDGECYVIFDDNDAKIVDHVRFHTSGDTEDLSIKEILQANIIKNAERVDKYGVNGRKQITGIVERMSEALRSQKEELQESQNEIVSFVKAILKAAELDDIKRGDLNQILTQVRNASSKIDLRQEFEKIADIVLDRQQRNASQMFGKLLSLKVEGTNTSGVSVAKSVSDDVRQTINTLKEYQFSSAEKLAEQVAELQDKLAETTDTDEKQMLENKLKGLELAQMYVDNVSKAKEDIRTLEDMLLENNNELKGKRGKEREALLQQMQATRDTIREMQIQLINDIDELNTSLRGLISEGRSDFKDFMIAKDNHRKDIIHYAMSDLQGVEPLINAPKLTPRQQRLQTVLEGVLSPVHTFNHELKGYARKAPDGKGYLYTHFVNGAIKASEKEFLGIKRATEMLDKKAQELFGMDWSKAMAKKSNQIVEGVNATQWLGGTEEEIPLTVGQIMYIYQVNKMSDGVMKLRQMGITQEDVEDMVSLIPTEMRELADWIQDTFLPTLRVEYNRTYKDMFGMQMPNTANYIPLQIAGEAIDQQVDVNSEDVQTLPSTITGNIIKRRVNRKRIDIANTDAMELMLSYINRMEHWNAYAPYISDVNTLLSSGAFRNKINALDRGNYKRFKMLAAITVGAYKPKTSAADKAINSAAKILATSKIAFRLNTALKQLASFPAFWADSSPMIHVYLAKNVLSTPHTIKWCMDNLPLFRKRWESGNMGNEKLDLKGENSKILDKISDFAKIGMIPNRAVDVFTCAMGAKSKYDDSFKRYKSMGYSTEEADERAKVDAEICYNETQQSSEGLMMSAIQSDRTFLSVALSTYQNSSFAYGRRFVEGIKEVYKYLAHKDEMIEFTEKKLIRDGVDPDLATELATKETRRGFTKGLADIAMFGYIIQFVWNLAGQWWALLLGDDDDKKKERVKDTAIQSAIQPIRGIAGGNILDSYLSSKIGGTPFNVASSSSVLFSDLASTIEKVSKGLEKGDNGEYKDKWLAINTLTRFATSATLAFDPQTFVNAIEAIDDLVNQSDGEITWEDVRQDMALFLSAPPSQIRDEFVLAPRPTETFKEYTDRYIQYKNIQKYGLFYPIRGKQKSDKLNTYDKKSVTPKEFGRRKELD